MYMDEPRFLCEHDCGFRGGYAAVEAHEAVCALRPGAEATLAIRRPEMQQLVDIDERDVPTGKRARTGQ